jgi:uracil phosphoribosyltransferase
MATLRVVGHPLVSHKIATLRDKNTKPEQFRRTCAEITLLTAYEGLRDLATKQTSIETPVATATASVLTEPAPAVIGILRAGLVMVEAILTLVPHARVGHLGMQRNEDTHEPIWYYEKIPSRLDEREVIVVDPMLATGGSASAAITHLKASGARKLRLLCIIGSPEGVQTVHAAHPDVPITLAAQDPGLTPDAYITPGLGDAGDRIYGTDK